MGQIKNRLNNLLPVELIHCTYMVWIRHEATKSSGFEKGWRQPAGSDPSEHATFILCKVGKTMSCDRVLFIWRTLQYTPQTKLMYNWRYHPPLVPGSIFLLAHWYHLITSKEAAKNPSVNATKQKSTCTTRGHEPYPRICHFRMRFLNRSITTSSVAIRGPRARSSSSGAGGSPSASRLASRMMSASDLARNVG